MNQERNNRKVRTGIVVSDKREKTVTVAIRQAFPHPKYGKIVRKTNTCTPTNLQKSVCGGHADS